MGTCQNCKNQQLFLKTKKCVVCDKTGCDQCMDRLNLCQAEGEESEEVYVCSEYCEHELRARAELTKFLKKILVTHTRKNN